MLASMKIGKTLAEPLHWLMLQSFCSSRKLRHFLEGLLSSYNRIHNPKLARLNSNILGNVFFTYDPRDMDSVGTI